MTGCNWKGSDGLKSKWGWFSFYFFPEKEQTEKSSIFLSFGLRCFPTGEEEVFAFIYPLGN
jgi:hypothetical protein